MKLVSFVSSKSIDSVSRVKLGAILNSEFVVDLAAASQILNLSQHNYYQTVIPH